MADLILQNETSDPYTNRFTCYQSRREHQSVPRATPAALMQQMMSRQCGSWKWRHQPSPYLIGCPSLNSWQKCALGETTPRCADVSSSALPSPSHPVSTPGSLSHPTTRPEPPSVRSLLFFLLIESNRTLPSSLLQTLCVWCEVFLAGSSNTPNNTLVYFWGGVVEARLDFIILLYVEGLQLQETLCSRFSVEMERCHTSARWAGFLLSFQMTVAGPQICTLKNRQQLVNTFPTSGTKNKQLKQEAEDN